MKTTIVRAAHEQAAAVGDDWVGPQHVVLALLAGESLAARVLAEAGLDRAHALECLPHHARPAHGAGGFANPAFYKLYGLKRSPRMNPGDSSRPNRAAMRMATTLLLGGSPPGPAFAGFHAPARDPVLGDASSALPAVSRYCPGLTRELDCHSHARPRLTIPGLSALPQLVPVHARSRPGGLGVALGVELGGRRPGPRHDHG
ncbi:Clp protease N-terminal domain-containing protein [Nonomuraea sp. NPDC003707]